MNLRENKYKIDLINKDSFKIFSKIFNEMQVIIKNKKTNERFTEIRLEKLKNKNIAFYVKGKGKIFEHKTLKGAYHKNIIKNVFNTIRWFECLADDKD